MEGEALSAGPDTEQVLSKCCLVRCWNWMEQLLVLRVENGSGLGGGCCRNYSELAGESLPNPFPIPGLYLSFSLPVELG